MPYEPLYNRNIVYAGKEMRVGLYCSGWFHPLDAKPNTSRWYEKIALGHQRRKIIYHDEITIGAKTYEKAYPKTTMKKLKGFIDIT